MKNKVKKVLILGSSGLLGRALCSKLTINKNIKLFHTGLKRRNINLNDKIQLRKLIFTINPDLIINCAAYTNIEQCEKNINISKKTNVEIVRQIFDLKSQKKMKFNFIQFSTDSLYNKKNQKSSKESSKIFLINNYCKHKRDAEKICIKNKALIFRTNFFGKSISKNKSFSDWLYKVFRSKNNFYLFKDVFFNPLRINTISKIISLIINQDKFKFNGIYNLGAREPIYKNKFAVLFAKKTRIFNKNYTNINVNELLKVKRSTNMYMNVSKFENKFNLKLPNIKSEIINESKKYLQK